VAQGGFFLNRILTKFTGDTPSLSVLRAMDNRPKAGAYFTMKIDDVRNDEASVPEGAADLSEGGRERLLFRQADFKSLPEAMDYAALSGSRLNFHNVRGHCEHTLSYTEVREQALGLAKRLRGLGLERGQHVGIVAEMHPDFIVMFYACQYGGLVAVPLPVVSGLGGSGGYELQLASIFENSEMKAIASPESLREILRGVAGALPSERIFTVAELLERTPSSESLVPLGGDEISHIQFSSGSTRFPLGVEISQRALMANARSIAADGLQMQSSDRVASWLPLYHDMGLVGQCIVPTTCQLTVDFLHPADFSRRPLQWLKLISKNGCTISFSPDFGYEICTRLGRREVPADLDLSRWRVAGIGGDMVRPRVIEQFAEVFAASGFKKEDFVPSYGLAEVTLAFSFESLQTGMHADEVDKDILTNEGRAVPAQSSSTPTRTFASCGIPMPGYQVEIRDKSGRVLPERQIGEVLIAGPSLMTGYYRQPDVTRQCLSGDGWLNTGDMGYLVGDRLFVTGRHKDMIIVKGRNIWPQDLEWHVEREIPGMKGGKSAAFAHQTAAGEEVAVILMQCRKSDLDEREQLRKEVASAISRNAGIVCQVELIPHRSLPYTTSGKLIRSKAKRNWLEGVYDQDGDDASFSSGGSDKIAPTLSR
jgi:fatty-acyl-CoA synthase